MKGQLANNKCVLLIDDEVVAQCRQGETLTYELDKPREITVKAGGGVGKPSIYAEPGDRFEVGWRGLGKTFIAKVDQVV